MVAVENKDAGRADVVATTDPFPSEPTPQHLEIRLLS